MKTKKTKGREKTLLATTVDGIKYDPVTRDYAVYVGGVIVGYAPNYSAAEELRLRVKRKDA